jgi:hypothetical protein
MTVARIRFPTAHAVRPPISSASSGRIRDERMDQSGQLCQRIQDGRYPHDGAAPGRTLDIASSDVFGENRSIDPAYSDQLSPVASFDGRRPSSSLLTWPAAEVRDPGSRLEYLSVSQREKQCSTGMILNALEYSDASLAFVSS